MSNPEISFLPPLEIKLAASDEATGVIEGYASVYNVRDGGGDVVEAGAFRETVAAHRKSRTAPLMLWSHKIDEPIGLWSHMAEDERGLKVVGQLNMNVQRAREVRALVRQGATSGLSIGYRIRPGGASYSGSTRTLKSLDLIEVSLVALPMNDLARITDVKAIETERTFEAWLKASGWPGRAAAKLARGGWAALDPKSENPDEVAALVKRIEAARLELKG